MFRDVAEMASHSSVIVLGFISTFLVGTVQERYMLADRDKEMIRQAVAGAVMSVITVDESGTITGFSMGAQKLFGMSAKEVVGQKMDILVPERMQNDHWREFTRAMTEPTRNMVEARCDAIRYVDGLPQEFPARISIWTHPYHGAVAIIRDESVIKDLTDKSIVSAMEDVQKDVQEVKEMVERNNEMFPF